MSEDWMKGMDEDEYAEWQKQWQKSPCPEIQMQEGIDFSDYGKIVVHPNVSELGLTIQFFPDTRSKLGSMLRLLDDYLQPRNIERSILIRSSKKFPTPCVILRGVFEQ